MNVTPFLYFFCRKMHPAFVWLLAMTACTGKKEPLFTLLPSSQTGVAFQNTLPENDSLNILDYLYYYNGGGVAIGDINNDGLQDLYFSANRGSNKLYLNKGNLKFEDITEKAGVSGSGNWKTGVTMADVNGDGFLDIYLCAVGGYKSLQGRNQLFINNGPAQGSGGVSFSEQAAAYNLDIEGFNTQATFFDYDRDGDLDLFLVNHSVHSTETYSDSSLRSTPNKVSGDKLFRNDKEDGKTSFTEVTAQAGIYSSALGYGLNVVAADFNNDGWDDLYVSNDFHENDYYYLNNGNGTFRESNRQAFGHESRFSMGSDVADINNDGWLDVMTLDMLPSDETVLKSSSGEDALDIYEFKMSKGYHHQYARNCLQLNVGGGKAFSDIALFAGVAATDWSWSPLLADFNNDGIKDLFVTNGIYKRPNDLDYLKFISGPQVASALQSGKTADADVIARMPPGKVPNYVFEGTPDLRFRDRSADWGADEPGFSNGAAYADLDNDGDLDVVVNNINALAGIYRNNTSSQTGPHYLAVQLKGAGQNTWGYGSKVLLRTKEGMQLQQLTATRGFQSASAPLLYFGLGATAVIDTLQVIWPDGGMQTLTQVDPNQRLVLHQKDTQAARSRLLPGSTDAAPLFVEVTGTTGMQFRHQEDDFVDFSQQQLLPHELSTEGPRLAVADVNGDGLDDFFVCGAKDQAGQLFVQTTAGQFSATNESLFRLDAFYEDVQALFFDADGDKDADLYVVSGGNEFSGFNAALWDRLYLNDGKGGFSKSSGLPSISANKSVARAADLDRDGDLDLFVGGRVVAGRYGEMPESYLLLNDGKGNFRRAPDAIASGLQNLGMVTDAAWTDLEGDGWPDLVLVGEWMPITVFKNKNGELENSTAALNLQNTTGLWTALLATDVDGDGRPELLAGNRGENSKLAASDAAPLRLYVGDIDENGSLEQILAAEKNGRYYPFLGKEELERVLPGFIRKRFLGYSDMAGRSVEEIFGERLKTLKQLDARMLASVLVKLEKGRAVVSRLPAPVQWAPVFSFLADDFDRDGKTDVLTAGNFFGVTPYEGRYDAGFPNLLLQKKEWQSLTPLQSGLFVPGEVRDLKKINTAGGRFLYLVARNNDSLLVFRPAGG